MIAQQSAIWQQYRRTAIYVQLTIVVVVVTFGMRGVFWPQLAAIFVVMEIASVLGAAWAVRLKRRAGDPTLLSPRRQTKY